MFDEMKQKLEQSLSIIQADMDMVRTGRAQPSLVEGISVEAYPGTWMKMNELAAISAADSHMLIVKPWDQSTLKKIESAITSEKIGVNPIVDGDIIRIGPTHKLFTYFHH
jgi:ribosome recycling factor